ncbi:urease accessory protein UreE [Trichothermofontia sp.]
MLVLTHRLPAGASRPRLTVPPLTLALTAEERTRSRHRFTTEEGEVVYLHLPRGTVLQQGDWLYAEVTAAAPAIAPETPISQHVDPQPVARSDAIAPAIAYATQYVQVRAKPEPVLTVTASTPLGLLQAAYHLGNRHVPLEITPHYLRLAPDPVLQTMLIQLGVSVQPEMAPFAPTLGAYHHSH